MGAGDNGLSPDVIGHCFVKQYYNYLRNEPESLHKLYKAHSRLSRGVEGSGAEGVASAFGVDEIHGEIMAGFAASGRGACSAKILGIDTQESYAGGLLVLVTGYLTFSQTSEARHFTQAFVLDKQTEPYPSYFVLNDILRYTAHAPAASADNSWREEPVAAQEQAHPAESQMPPMQPPPQQPPSFAEPARQAELPVAPQAQAKGGMEHEGCGDEQDEAEEECEEDAGDHAAEGAADEAGEVDGGEGEEEDEEEGHPEEWEPQSNEPKTWASMANKLRQGPGQLAPSKRTGFAMSGAPAPKMPVLPPPGTSSRAEAAKTPASAASPPAAAPPAMAGDRTPSDGKLRVWVSKLPLEAEGKDVVECINALVAEAGAGGKAVEVERKDPAKDWGYLVVSSQEAADAVVQLSTDRKLLFKGKPLKAQPSQAASPSAGGSPGKGAGGRPKGGGRGPRPTAGGAAAGLPPPGSTGAGGAGTAGGQKGGGRRGGKGDKGDKVGGASPGEERRKGKGGGSKGDKGRS